MNQSSKIPRPNLFIVGVPKAGTTSVHHHLAGHPEVFMSRVKELYHFSPDLRIPPLSDEGYLEQFRPGTESRWRGESTPLYMVSTVAAERMARFSPSARIVILLREPVEMMHALHGQHLADSVPSHRDFETELRLQEEARRRGESKSVPGFLRMPWLLEVADYASQIRRFRDHFPAAQIRVILFDEFIKDPEETHARLLEWLGLESQEVGEVPRMGSNRLHVDPWIVRMVRSVSPITQVLRRIVPGPVDWLAECIRRAGSRSLPPLDPADHIRLQNEFFPDFTELETLIGRSLEHWRLNQSMVRRPTAARIKGSSGGPAAPAGVERTQASKYRVPGRTPTLSALRPSH
ncbi:MAG: sulfotransferase family protein [Verrucomicrobiota bacterium]